MVLSARFAPPREPPCTPEPVGGGEAASAASRPVALRLGRPDGCKAWRRREAHREAPRDRPSRTTTGLWRGNGPLDASLRPARPNKGGGSAEPIRTKNRRAT